MTLKVVDATETDIPEMIRMELSAYKESLGENLLFPQGRSPEMLQSLAENLLKAAREDPSVKNIKVIDLDNHHRPIAFARWHLYIGENVQHSRTDTSQGAAIPGADPIGLAIWNDVVRKRRYEHIGTVQHCCKV